jgi:hypothetical protein
MTHNHQIHRANQRGIRTSDIGMDNIELVVLELVRHFCQTYAEPLSHNWELALQRAVQELGPLDGGRLVVSVVELLRAVRVERQTPFAFIDANCKKCADEVLPVELHLIMATRFARQQDPQNLKAESVALIGGEGDAQQTYAMAAKLGHAMNAISPFAEHPDLHLAVQSRLVH